MFANYDLRVASLGKQSALSGVESLAAPYPVFRFFRVHLIADKYSECKHLAAFIRGLPDIRNPPRCKRTPGRFAKPQGDCIGSGEQPMQNARLR